MADFMRKPKHITNRIALFWAKVPWISYLVRNLGPFVVLIAIWQIATMLQIWPPKFLPKPSTVPVTAAQLYLRGTLVKEVALTIARVMSGASMGFILGALLAIVFAMIPALWKFLQDVINYLQAVGEIGWLPVFALWSGFNDRTVILTIGYTVFFPVFYGTLSSFRSVPTNLTSSVRTLGGSDWDIAREVLFPGSLPGLITGLRTGLGFGWRSVILAEMLISQSGLGVVIFKARELFRIDIIIVGMIIAGLLWLITDKLLLEPLERRTIQRWGIQRKPA